MDFVRNNLANLLTIARILLLPVIIWLFYVEQSWGAPAAWLCFLLYILCSITDFFDGYVARKLNQITAIGTFLDPVSDKIFVASMLLLLTGFDRIQGIWIIPVIIIFAREFLISGLREYLGPKNIKVPVSFLAKWKTTVQMLAIGFLIIAPYAPYALEIGLITLSIAAILTVITALQYLWVVIRHMKNS